MLGAEHSWRAAVVAAAVLVAAGPLAAADVNLFPDDTELVVVVNLKQIFAAEAVKSQPDAREELRDVLGQFAGVHAAQAYLKEAGLDAFRDVRSITLVYTGAKDPRVGLVVLDGAFDSGKLADAARGGGSLRAVKAGGDAVYEITPRAGRKMYAALVNPATLIAAADAETLAEVRARVAGTRKPGLKKELRVLLEARDDGRSVAVVSTGAALARVVDGAAIPNGETAVAFLRTQGAISGWVTLGTGIGYGLTLNAESDEAAKKLAESANSGVRLLLTLARQRAETDERYRPVAEVVTGFRFTSRGPRVLFRGEMSLDTVERLMSSFPAGRSGQGPK